MDTRLMDEMNAQLQGMRKLLVSDEWSLWANFLKRERRGYLQNKVNAAIREKRYDEASVALALYDDCTKQIELFGRHISDTESKLKGNINGDKK